MTTAYEDLAKLNPFRYRGYVWDEETGLYYLRSRYYNPEWGRFVNPDQIISAVGDLTRSNNWAYCGNSPVSYKDPDGAWFGFDDVITGPIDELIAVGIVGILAGLGNSWAQGMLKQMRDGVDSVSGASTKALDTAVKLTIPDIAGRYGNFKCKEAAKSVSEFLKKHKQRGEIITISYPLYPQGSGFIVSDTYGVNEAISTNGIHQGVKYKGMVYCNIHPYGLSESQWLDDFHGDPEWARTITYTPF